MKLIAIDPWAGAGPGFNRQAADVVHKAMSVMDADTALVYGRLLVAESLRYDMYAHREELAKAAAEVVAARTELLRGHYTRTAVSKARAGVDNGHEIACLVQIAKVGFDFTDAQRHQYTAARHRGPSGRFVTEHAKIISEDRESLDQEHATKLGMAHPDNLQGVDVAHYQQAFSQIEDMLAPFHQQDLNALLHLHIKNKTTNAEKDITVAVEPRTKGKDGQLTSPGVPKFAHRLQPGDRVESAAVSVTPATNAPGAVFDTVAALAGGGYRGDRAGGYAADAMDGVFSTARVKQYNESAKVINGNEPYSSASRVFGRMERGSAILQDSLGEQAPKQMQYALAIANHVGQFGPEAQKVFGPAADRTAYRYRGTERTPAPEVYQAFDDLKSSGYKGEDLRDAAVEGIEEGRGIWNPGPVLRYFHRQLPNPDLNELHRKSGVVPPSEGIIIAAGGNGRQVAVQSVGYADDWYLPFNLRHLASLKGGEYIRTRTFGGPTTEDIYTGLVSGAKHLSVVSHNGVYTVDFDRNLRGGRRFNDKAARMVARYGQLLDALRSGDVGRGGISPSRNADLKAQARDHNPDESSTAFKNKLEELQAEEKQHPTLSQSERDKAAVGWLGATAAKIQQADGRPSTPQQFVADLVTQTARNSVQRQKETVIANQAAGGTADPSTVFTLQQFKDATNTRLAAAGESSSETYVRAVSAMMADGQTDRLDRAVEQAASDNRDRVSPLHLDGKGYADALTALQEQFPYYIAAVHYHPWKNSVGLATLTDRTHDNAWDSGYVAPRHNRPEGASAGYYNSDVWGKDNTKVKASSTRYQNFRVHQGVTQPAKVKVRDDALDNPAGVTPEAAAFAQARNIRMGVGATPTAAAAAGNFDHGPRNMRMGLRRVDPNDPRLTGQVDEMDPQRLADLALAEDLLTNTTWAPGAKLYDANGPVEMNGSNIRDDIADQNFPPQYGAIKTLFSIPDRAALEAVPDLPDLLDQLLAHTQGPEPLLRATPKKVGTFLNRGRELPPEPAPEVLFTILQELDEDHTYPGAGVAYTAGGTNDTDVIGRAYIAEPHIRSLIDLKELPLVSAPDDEFKAAATALKESLDAARAEQLRLIYNGARRDQPLIDLTTRHADGLQRAMQLQRRYQEAKRRQPPPPPPPPAPPAPIVTNKTEYNFDGWKPEDFANLTDEQRNKMLSGMKIAPEPAVDPSRIIEAGP